MGSGISVQTLARWRVEGRGPRFLKLGSRVVYQRSALDAFLKAHERGSTSTEKESRTDPTLRTA